MSVLNRPVDPDQMSERNARCLFKTDRRNGAFLLNAGRKKGKGVHWKKDLVRHQVIDLLAERSSQSAADWMRQHPEHEQYSIKRMGYSRAGFPLLRQRVLHAL